MIKRLTVAVAALLVLAGQAFGAGTIPFSLSQQLDKYAKPLAGCLFYTIQAGTTSTPQNAYQDSALTIPLPNPQTCDSAGRLPQMFLADGTVKVRLSDKSGVTQLVADNIQVIGASSGGGGGGTVDPTTIMATGDMKTRYGTGVLTGFVRANGRTIGSATSGATERANSDTQALFEYLWQTDSTLVVSTGRGASSNADWTANKNIALPDWRGQGMAFLDDMGNSAAGVLTLARFGSSPIVLGNKGGNEATLFAQSALPNINLPLVGTGGGTYVLDAGTNLLVPFAPVNYGGGGPATFSVAGFDSGGLKVTLPNSSGATRLNGNVTQTAIPNTVPRRLATLYVKL